ncbi:hypothetical protein KM043_010635 [Ampulex compressa]|nr:hypothetical protein KM043_010635 [Ampulex compressa]
MLLNSKGKGGQPQPKETNCQSEISTPEQNRKWIGMPGVGVPPVSSAVHTPLHLITSLAYNKVLSRRISIKKYAPRTPTSTEGSAETNEGHEDESKNEKRRTRVASIFHRSENQQPTG